MELLMRVKTKSMLNWLSFCGYHISQLLWYFLFDVVYCYVCQTREQQRGQDSSRKTKCVTSHHQGQDVMVVGIKPVTGNIIQAVYTPSSALNTVNSDDSDYDGDDESSEEDDIDNEMEINSAKQKLEYHGRSTSDAREERFEMAPEQWEVTTAIPSKPKKSKSKKKCKQKTNKRSKPSKTKEKKPKGSGAMTNQLLMGTVTDDPVKWDEGTQQHHHPIKRPSNKRRSVATADEGSCTTSCVQCCDTD